jgi:hypothetical protein
VICVCVGTIAVGVAGTGLVLYDVNQKKVYSEQPYSEALRQYLIAHGLYFIGATSMVRFTFHIICCQSGCYRNDDNIHLLYRKFIKQTKTPLEWNRLEDRVVQQQTASAFSAAVGRLETTSFQ